MQILESSIWALRAARLSLKSQLSAIQITLFPMVHVGEPDFFQTVYEDAFSHDVVVVEGLRSPIVQRITRSYRWVEKSKSMGLITQPPYPSVADSDARIIHADLSGAEFAVVWREVPLWLRAAVYFLAPIIGLERQWFGSRQTLAKGLSLDNSTSRHEILDFSPETIALTQAILDVRDSRLIEQLSDHLDDPATETRRLAVVYGAYHMRAVLRELIDHRGYQVVRGDWLIIFLL
jgi:hypothetical protein